MQADDIWTAGAFMTIEREAGRTTQAADINRLFDELESAIAERIGVWQAALT